jgi:hypothetical protein
VGKKPDYDERFSLYGEDPEEVARALVEQGPMEDVDEAEECEDTE